MRTILVTLVLAAALATPSQAAVITWSAVLSGSQEIPPVSTTATGAGWVQYDDVTNTLSLYLEWSGLTDDAVQAHIHCCVATPPGNVGIAVDLWLPSDPPRPATGTYSAAYDLDLVNPFRATFIAAHGGTTAGALAALVAAMTADEGRAYYNIHTALFPGGEIRGNLSPAAVPEPAGVTLMLLGAAALLARRRLAGA